MDLPQYTPREDARWEDIQHRELAFADERLDRYCAALKSIYAHGSPGFMAFEATDRDHFFSAHRYDRRGTQASLEALLGQAALRSPFSGGILSYGNPRHEHVEIVDQRGCQFEGFLADVLLGGGAYYGWKGSVKDAKELAGGAVAGMRAVAPDRPWSPFIVRGPWCSCFHDIAWDYTFAVQFPYDARWFILWASDTD